MTNLNVSFLRCRKLQTVFLSIEEVSLWETQPFSKTMIFSTDKTTVTVCRKRSINLLTVYRLEKNKAKKFLGDVGIEKRRLSDFLGGFLVSPSRSRSRLSRSGLAWTPPTHPPRPALPPTCTPPHPPQLLKNAFLPTTVLATGCLIMSSRSKLKQSL